MQAGDYPQTFFANFDYLLSSNVGTNSKAGALAPAFVVSVNIR
jgi:hypothetical protein